MRTKKIFCLICVHFFLYCLFPFLGSAKNSVKIAETIIVVSDDNYPPYIFRDANGNIQGILVDEWALWEKKTGVRVQLSAMDWGKAKEVMRNGKADVIDTIFFTEQRAALYDFTKPYASIDVPVFFNKNIGGIVNIESLQGFTIGVKTGDASIDVLKKNGITSLQEYNSYEAIIQAAVNREIKVFSIDKPPALYYLYKMNFEDEFRHSLNLYTGKFHRAVKKDRSDLLIMVEDGFAMITKKEHDAINKKWMGEPLVRPGYFRPIIFFILFVGLIFLVLIIFNMTLRRKVGKKTAELQEIVNQLGLSEERFRIIFEQAAVGVSLCDSRSGNFIRVNQRYCDIIGYTAEEIKQLSFQAISHPEDFQKDLAYMSRLLDGQIREFSMEKRYIRKDGSIVWVKLTVSPMWKEGERPHSHIAIVEDITESKQKRSLQAALLNLVEYARTHSVKELLQKFLDEAEALTDSEMGFYHFIEDDQKTVSVQTWSTNTLAHKCKAASTDQHYSISRAGIWADCIRERKPVIHNDYANLKYKKGMPEDHAPVIRELVVPVIRGEKIMAVIGVGNKKTDYGAIDIEMVQQLADMAWETVTRKQGEEEIRKREIFLNAIIENIPNMLFVKDATDLRFVRFNKAGEKIIGLNREEMLGKNDYDFFPQNEADFFTQKDRETLRKGELLNIPEETIQTLHKGVRTLHTIKIPLFDQKGQPEYLLGISEDITERRQLEEQLRQTQKMESIGTLAGGIAHDFNNILSGIFGFSQLAKNHLKEPKRVEKDIDQVIKGANKAAELVQQILAVSRKTVQKQQPVSIHIVVKEALKLLRASIPSTIQIKETIASKATVMADPAKIHQVVMNLCTNAYHAMLETGGTMAVALNEIEFGKDDAIPGSNIGTGRFLKLEISDTGQGMDADILDKIFEPYFTTKDPGKGTGLGLAVVFAIIQEHKGHINVHSEPGQGTTIHVFLPISDVPAMRLTSKKNKETPVSGMETIMFVDDEEALRDLAHELFNELGYVVYTFSNGINAFEAYKNDMHGFDLVITDMTMPGITGLELSQKIIDLCSDQPIILCTGHSESINREKALSIGISEYIEKPIITTQLAEVIRKILDREKI